MAGIHEINAQVIDDERQIPISSADIQSAEMLNAEQRVIFEHVMHCVNQNSSAIIFVDGLGAIEKLFSTVLCLLLLEHRALLHWRQLPPVLRPVFYPEVERLTFVSKSRLKSKNRCNVMSVKNQGWQLYYVKQKLSFGMKLQ